MQGIISVLGTPINVAIKLAESIRKYQRKKDTELLIASSFEAEAQAFIAAYEELVNLSENEVVPVIIEAEEEITPHSLNQLLEKMIPVPLKTAEWIDAFVSIAKACNEASVFKGLMEHLKEDDILLYDFVNLMKSMYDDNAKKVTIGGTYFRFFRTYESKIFGDINIRKLKSASEEFEPIIKKAKPFARKVRHYMTKTSLIKRKTIKKYLKNYKILDKSAKSLSIDPDIVKDLSHYVPDKLLPIALVIDNLS